MIINRIRIRRINETRTEKREVVRLAKKNLESRTRRKKRKKKREKIEKDLERKTKPRQR